MPVQAYSDESSFPSWHGKRGPIHTSHATSIDHLSPLFVTSAINSGLPRSHDFNEPQSGRYGVGYFDFNIFRGIRDSAAKVFMSSILRSKPFNFHIELKAQVNKIIIEKTIIEANIMGTFSESQEGENIAVGVVYEEGSSGKMKRAYLKRSCVNGISRCIQPREVILSAGSLMTPSILLHSGVGSQITLQNSDVGVKALNENVGKNLQDHPAVGFIARLSSSMAALYPTAYTMAEQWVKYIKAINDCPRELESSYENCSVDYGLWGSAGIYAGAFLKSPYTLEAPDIQLTVFPSVSEPHLRRLLRTNNIMSKMTDPSEPQMLITIALLNPDARYNVVLNSSDYFRNIPKIVLPRSRKKYLTDLDTMKLEWGINYVRKIADTEPLSSVVLEESLPGIGTSG